MFDRSLLRTYGAEGQIALHCQSDREDPEGRSMPLVSGSRGGVVEVMASLTGDSFA